MRILSKIKRDELIVFLSKHGLTTEEIAIDLSDVIRLSCSESVIRKVLAKEKKGERIMATAIKQRGNTS